MTALHLERDDAGLPDGAIEYAPAFLSATEADRAFAALLGSVRWSQHRVRILGREHPCPRLSAWYGDAHAVYRYSGQTLEPLPLTGALAALRARVVRHCGEPFDGVLVNLYRDGRDGMGWHSDDEKELGADPTIASVSLGAERRFRMKHRTRRDLEPRAFALAHGSLFVMRGATQRHWRHAVPKTARPVGPRINLTFRCLAGATAGARSTVRSDAGARDGATP